MQLLWKQKKKIVYQLSCCYSTNCLDFFLLIPLANSKQNIKVEIRLKFGFEKILSFSLVLESHRYIFVKMLSYFERVVFNSGSINYNLDLPSNLPLSQNIITLQL